MSNEPKISKELRKVKDDFATHLEQYNAFVKRKIMMVTRNVSSGSGIQTIEGIGFEANKLTVFCTLEGSGLHSNGIELMESNMTYYNSNDGNYYMSTGVCGAISADVNNLMTISIINKTNDSFDISWSGAGDLSTFGNIINVSILAEG